MTPLSENETLAVLKKELATRRPISKHLKTISLPHDFPDQELLAPGSLTIIIGDDTQSLIQKIIHEKNLDPLQSLIYQLATEIQKDTRTFRSDAYLDYICRQPTIIELQYHHLFPISFLPLNKQLDKHLFSLPYNGMPWDETNIFIKQQLAPHGLGNISGIILKRAPVLTELEMYAQKLYPGSPLHVFGAPQDLTQRLGNPYQNLLLKAHGLTKKVYG